ncbi:hypothetical protein ABZ341_17970 [Streptomyces sp. NPDC006173]|uniref:hypothetical protein n=1 Tax=Streptomyces sp. NPDC006173 TaxID=3155349 RepID=UPI0033C958F9
MKCGEPKPGGIYEDCDKELRHGGDHSYLGRRWPRVKPTEGDWDINELLDNQTPRDSWGVMERSFPIVVTETVTRVIWVEAETEDQALAYWGDDPTELPRDGEALDFSFEFERPDKWQRQVAFTPNRIESKIGPLIKCPGCDAEAFRREWVHNPLRKCHGPIEWRETSSAKPQWRWRREHKSTPVHGIALKAVAA